MTDNHNKSFKEKDLIALYGKAFRNNLSKKVIDLDINIQIDFNFQIHRIEDLVKEFNGFIPPNRISHYVVALIKEGSGFKSIGHFNFMIHPNMAMIIPKHGIHSSKNWNLGNKGYMLSFNDDFFLKMNFPKSLLNLSSLFKFSREPHCILPEKMTRKLAVLFEEMISEQGSTNALKTEILCVKVAEIIILYHRIFNTVSIDKNPNNILYERFVELLEKKYVSEKSVQFYADELCIHPNHLNFVIKKHTGFSVKKNIQNRVILEAKYLLSVTNLSVKEISFELGFNDQNYFSCSFKRSEKISALEYRKTIV